MLMLTEIRETEYAICIRELGECMESRNQVRITVPAGEAARVQAPGSTRDIKTAALLGCHKQSCEGSVSTSTLETGALAVCVTCEKPGCEVIDGGPERVALGITSSAKHFGGIPSKK